MAAAIVHDVGRAREFTYGAEFGLSEEGRMLGHLAIGAEIVGAAARRPARRAAARRCSTACSPTTAPTRAGPRRKVRARRVPAGLRLARGAGALPAQRPRRVGQGPLWSTGRARLTRVCAATTRSRSANARPRAPARETAFAATTPTSTPRGESAPIKQPVAQADVAEPLLAPGADDRRRGRSPGARSPRRGSAARRGRSPAPGTNRMPPADAEQAADRAAGEPERCCEHVLHQPTSSSIATTTSSDREQERDRALRDPLLERRAGEHAADRRDPDQRPSSRSTLP